MDVHAHRSTPVASASHRIQIPILLEAKTFESFWNPLRCRMRTSQPTSVLGSFATYRRRGSVSQLICKLRPSWKQSLHRRTWPAAQSPSSSFDSSSADAVSACEFPLFLLFIILLSFGDLPHFWPEDHYISLGTPPSSSGEFPLFPSNVFPSTAVFIVSFRTRKLPSLAVKRSSYSIVESPCLPGTFYSFHRRACHQFLSSLALVWEFPPIRLEYYPRSPGTFTVRSESPSNVLYGSPKYL